MTAAYRLKHVGWLGAVAVVTLGFYLVSLQVAAERKHLDQVNAKIDSAERDIRALETEFDVRSNLAQLERWNGETLSLAAPVAAQFVQDGAQLASLDLRGAGGEIRTAQLLVPAFHAPVIAEPQLQGQSQPQSAPAAAPAPVSVTPAAGIALASVSAPRKPVAAPVASPTRVVTGAVTRSASTVATVKAAAPAARRAQAVAMLDRSLLSDSTLGEILKGVRAETGRVR